MAAKKNVSFELVLPSKVMTSDELSGSDKFVFGVLNFMAVAGAKNKKSTTATNADIADIAHIGQATVIKSIKALADKGFITIKTDKKNLQNPRTITL